MNKIIKFKNIFVSAVRHFVFTAIVIPMIPAVHIINSCFGKKFEAINFSKTSSIKVLRKSSTEYKNIWCHDGRNDDDCVGGEFKGLFVSAVRKFIWQITTATTNIIVGCARLLQKLKFEPSVSAVIKNRI